jgi:hypothetical protein
LFFSGFRFAWDLVGLVLVLGGGGWCHVAKNDGVFGGGGGMLEKASKREEEYEKEQQF